MFILWVSYCNIQRNPHSEDSSRSTKKISEKDKEILQQYRELSAAFDQLAIPKLSKRGLDYSLAITSIQYTLQEVEEVKDRVLIEGASFRTLLPNVEKDLSLAHSLNKDLEKWYAPFRRRVGDMRLAYQVKGSKKLEPFRLFIPDHLTLSTEHPLVVGLHGRSGDENSFMDSYGLRSGEGSVVKKWATEYEYIVVCPRGGGPGSGYREEAATDVVEVTKLIKEIYHIPANEVFLMGHSMGGGGTMLIGLDHPALYRALAPIGGGLWVAGSKKKLTQEAKDLPVRYFHGTSDKIVPLQSGALASTKEVLTDFELVKIQGANHSKVFYEALPMMFDFFNEVSTL